jgi:SAM-dependent methyltransferase
VRLVEQDPTHEMVTSDMDAPGPFVGSYPYRRTAQSMIQASNEEMASARLNRFNSELSRQFGGVASAVTMGGKSDTTTTQTSAPGTLWEQHPLSNAMTNFSVRSLGDMILAKAKEVLGRAPSATAISNMESAKPITALSQTRYVEVGCGAGAVSFHLAEHFDTVLAFDHDGEMIDTARAIQQGKGVRFTLRGEGELTGVFEVASSKVITTNTNGMDHNESGKMLDFRMADPMCLPAEINSVDVVFLNDMLDTVSSPNSVLGRLGGVRGLVRPGGLLVLSSSFQWSEETTPKSLWIGGTAGASNPDACSLDVLQEKLSSEFDLVEVKKVPVLWADSLVDIRGKIYNVSFWVRK